MTRMSDKAEARRETVENALASLGTMQIEIVITRVRVEQAIKRWPGTRSLLHPVVIYLLRWERFTALAQAALVEKWQAGNRNNWRQDEHEHERDHEYRADYLD